MCCPSGERATDETQLVCPVNGPATVSPVVALRTRIVESCEPDTMCCPSGKKATDETDSVCPVNGPVTNSPVVAFHTQIV